MIIEWILICDYSIKELKRKKDLEVFCVKLSAANEKNMSMCNDHMWRGFVVYELIDFISEHLL